MPDRESRVPHPPGRVDQLVKQTHLDGSPASVRACDRRHRASEQGFRGALAAGPTHEPPGAMSNV